MMDWKNNRRKIALATTICSWKQQTKLIFIFFATKIYYSQLKTIKSTSAN